jgi:uncharacterized protein (DUF1778 family)
VCSTVTRQVSFRLSERERDLLASKARAAGMSRKQFVVAAVEAYEAPELESVVDDLSRRMAALEEMASRGY